MQETINEEIQKILNESSIKEEGEGKEEKKAKIIGKIFYIENEKIFMLDSLGQINIVSRYSDMAKIDSYYEVDGILNRYLDEELNYYIISLGNKSSFKEVKGENFHKKYAIIQIIVINNSLTNKNIKARISIFNNKNLIINIKEPILFISSIKNDNSSYYLEYFKLELDNKSNIFELFIYKGEINKVNLVLDSENFENRKAYEVIYLSKKKKFLPKEIIVSNIKFGEFDSYSCQNRVRFNIININQDKNLYNINDRLTSYEIIYLIDQEGKKKKYGVFNVQSSKEEFILKFDINKYKELNNKLSEIWNEFCSEKAKKSLTLGKLSNNFYLDEKMKISLDQIRNFRIGDYISESLENQDVYIFFRNFCFYEFALKFRQNFIIFYDFIKQIEIYSNKIKIKMLLFYTFLVKKYSQYPALIDIKSLKEISAYKLAIDLQKKIILNLSEESNLFYPMIQFNSKIMEMLPNSIFEYYYNWAYQKIMRLFGKKLLNNSFAYSVSLENIDDMRNHLLSIEEDYLFIFNSENNFNFYGFYSSKYQMTLINSYVIFKNVKPSTEDEMEKNKAFALNILLSHERMSHGKEIKSNYGIDSPTLYFDINFDLQNIGYIYTENTIRGEPGRILENFMGTYLQVKIFKEIKNFGNFLDYKYYITDFKELRNHANKILQDSSSYSNLIKKNKYKFYLFNFLILVLSICIFYYFGNSYISYIFLFVFVFLFLYVNNYFKHKEVILYGETFDIINPNIKEESNESDGLIFPDDYPPEPTTILGKIISFFDWKRNEIKSKMLKDIYDDGDYVY